MLNKSVLNWTQVCQLHCKTQLHETRLSAINRQKQGSQADKAGGLGQQMFLL